MSSNVTPRIYVACLSSYNAGTLFGRWIDATQDAREIRAEIREMLAESPEPGAEEYAIHDYEGFGDLRLSEYEDIEAVSRVAQLMEEHGELFAAVVEHVGGTRYLDEAIRLMEECYEGYYDSLADWAEQRAVDMGVDCAEPYRNYIDWERFGNDSDMSGDIQTIEVDGKVHVFTA